jgi:hypothetical protein
MDRPGGTHEGGGTMSIALVFTGHMIDSADRDAPRFPASLEGAARAAIGDELDRLTPRAIARGFASGACGGDILFHEECRRRGIPTTVVLPYQPDQFVETSVENADGGDWPRRFRALWAQTPAEARLVLGLPITDQAFAACNARLLDLAREHGSVHLIALWDGEGGDGPGGTADMVRRVTADGDQPHIIAPQDLVRS